jgi:hypothetical protein
MKQITKEQAIEIAKSGSWKNWSKEDIVKVQLYQKRLCMDFGKFQEAVEYVLKRPVFTHEFGDQKRLITEYETIYKTPSELEIFDIIKGETNGL